MTTVIVANDLVGFGKVALTSSLQLVRLKFFPYQRFFCLLILVSLTISMYDTLQLICKVFVGSGSDWILEWMA